MDCQLKGFKIDLPDYDDDEPWLGSGVYKVGDPDTESTDLTSNFEVEVWNNGETFTWESNMPVYHVWVKGSREGGYLYSYPNGSYNDCGLRQPPNPQGGLGESWSHITFYYCETLTEFSCETAWAYGGESIATAFTDIDDLNASHWGWTNGPLDEGEYEFELWAGAGSNVFDNGTFVGTVSVDYIGEYVTVRYQIDSGYSIKEVHLYVGETKLPEIQQGQGRGQGPVIMTSVPGQFPYIAEDLDTTDYTFGPYSGFSGDIYVAAHAVVCSGTENLQQTQEQSQQQTQEQAGPARGLKIQMRGKPFQTDLPPVVVSGRTLIPLRAVANGLDADVEWNEGNITISRGGVTIEFNVDEEKFYVDGVEHIFDVKANIVNNRTFVALRFIAQALGEKVDFDANSLNIYIGE